MSAGPGAELRCCLRGRGSLGAGKEDEPCFHEVRREAVRLPQMAVPPLDRAGSVGVQVRRSRTVAGHQRYGAELPDPRVATLGPLRERFVVVHVRSVVGQAIRCSRRRKGAWPVQYIQYRWDAGVTWSRTESPALRRPARRDGNVPRRPTGPPGRLGGRSSSRRRRGTRRTTPSPDRTGTARATRHHPSRGRTERRGRQLRMEGGHPLLQDKRRHLSAPLTVRVRGPGGEIAGYGATAWVRACVNEERPTIEPSAVPSSPRASLARPVPHGHEPTVPRTTPPGLVCLIHAYGMRRTAQVAMTRSYGARCGWPRSPSPVTVHVEKPAASRAASARAATCASTSFVERRRPRPG